MDENVAVEMLVVIRYRLNFDAGIIKWRIGCAVWERGWFPNFGTVEFPLVKVEKPVGRTNGDGLEVEQEFSVGHAKLVMSFKYLSRNV